MNKCQSLSKVFCPLFWFARLLLVSFQANLMSTNLPFSVQCRLIYPFSSGLASSEANHSLYDYVLQIIGLKMTCKLTSLLPSGCFCRSLTFLYSLAKTFFNFFMRTRWLPRSHTAVSIGRQLISHQWSVKIQPKG